MKILHVLDHSLPVQDGYAYRTFAILQNQHRRGWETAHLTSTKHELKSAAVEQVEGLEFYRTPPSESWMNRLPLLDQWSVVASLRDRLEEVIRIEQPDLLHAHSPSLMGLAAIKAARAHGLKVVYECRAFWEDAAVDNGTTTEGSLRYRITRALESHVFRNADAVTCICEGLREDIQARGIPAEKITVIPNAVDIEKFPRLDGEGRAVRESLGLGDVPVMGFIGSFYAWEGLSLAVAAMPAILREVPDLKLLFVGGGKEEDNLRRQAEELGLGDKVVFAGRVPHSEVFQYYDAVDLLVYPRPSMRLTETVTPLKPLEAMALHKNFLASDVGGHRELVEDGVTGRLFRAGDAQALADTVVDMFQRRGQWSALTDAGRRYVEEERNWAASVARYAPVYERLAK